MFGVKFLNAGIRKKDKDLNRRLALYKAWGKNLVNERVTEIKKKIEEGNQETNSNDLIEAITKNSLKETKEG